MILSSARPHDPVYVDRTVEVIRTLAAKYGSPPYSDTVTMIELLNEPAISVSDEMAKVTKQYYLDAYEAARWPWGREAGNQTDLIIVFHDGFRELMYWDGFLTGDEFEKVWIDDHYYQVFGVIVGSSKDKSLPTRMCCSAVTLASLTPNTW
jgi:glucan 1,3-beta-glucosidase